MAYYAVERTESLKHYGRLGMKWYQHIYGAYQGTAKYAAKGQKKVNRLQAKTDKKNTKIDKKIAKLQTKAPAKGRFDRNQYKISDLKVKKTKNFNKLWDLRTKVADVRNKADDIKNSIEPKETRFKEYEAALKNDGWKRNDKYAYGNHTNFEKTIKVGDNSVWVNANCDGKEDAGTFKELVNSSLSAVTKNNESIRNSVVNDAYSELTKYGWGEGVSKSDFKKGLRLSSIQIDSLGCLVNYEDESGFSYDHEFSAEVDNKGKYYRYSMNG